MTDGVPADTVDGLQAKVCHHEAYSIHNQVLDVALAAETLRAVNSLIVLGHGSAASFASLTMEGLPPLLKHDAGLLAQS